MAIQKNISNYFYCPVVSLLIIRSVLYLFRTGPVSFNLLQRLPGSLRYEFPDNQHIRYAHNGEQEECSGGGKVLEHPGGQLSDQVRSDPQSESCYRHGQSANLGGIHLREEHEHHGTDRHGTAEYIEQEENEQEEAGYSQAFAEKKVSTDQEKGKDHARYAVVNQFLTSHFVDDDKRQNGGQGVN